MKKLLIQIITAFMMLSLNCCEKEEDFMIWDITPAGVFIEITDKDGNNLLDPAMEGNLVGEKMQIVYDGETYDAIWEKEDLIPETRYYLPTFHGLMWEGMYYSDTFPNCPKVLYFGEFDGTHNYDMRLQFRIEGINTVFEFEYHHDYKTNWKGEPKIDNNNKYKGKKIKGDTVTLVI